jgi:hypothetical protein
MKKIKIFLATVLFLFLATSFSPQQAKAQLGLSVSSNFFMITCLLMVNGFIIHYTDISGIPMRKGASALTEQEDIGYGLMNMNGFGFPTIIGVGQLSTTDAGSTILIMAGCGCPIMTGLLHG